MKTTPPIFSSPTSTSCPKTGSGYRQRLLAASLALGLALLVQSAHSQPVVTPALIGNWFVGTTNLADTSGYTPQGTHDGYFVGSTNYLFTNDVPPGRTGYSLYFPSNDTGIAISNSSTTDGTGYLDTFDGTLTNAFTIRFWAKTMPGAWNPWVSKCGENEQGWQFRDDGSSGRTYACFTVRDGTIGSVNLGAALFGNPDDMATRSIPTGDANWHLYAGLFNASNGVRSMYIDGVLAAHETNNVAYFPAPDEHLCIGARDVAGTIGSFSSFEIYNVRIYNYAVNPAPPVPVPLNWQVNASGQLVLTWPFGTLYESTNVTGLWRGTLVTPPYTNNMTLPKDFFKAQNP